MNIQKLIDDAFEDINIRDEFDITIRGQKIRVYLDVIDVIDMSIAHESAKEYLLERFTAQGDHNRPIDEKQWQDALNEIKDEKDRKAAEENKPANYAEQQARRWALVKTMSSVAPDKLKLAESNEPLCPTPESIDKLKKIILSDHDIVGSITKSYTTLLKKKKETNSALKN